MVLAEVCFNRISILEKSKVNSLILTKLQHGADPQAAVSGEDGDGEAEDGDGQTGAHGEASRQGKVAEEVGVRQV